MPAASSSTIGERIALAIAIALLAGAAYVGLQMREPGGAAILALISASAFSGWLKARSKRTQQR